MALTHDRGTVYRVNDIHHDPVAAGSIIYAGAIVMLNADGYAIAGRGLSGLIARGVAQEQVDNRDGFNGEVSVTSRAGCHCFRNDGSITRPYIGDWAFVVDDETVSAINPGVRSGLGHIVDVDPSGVWVAIE